MLSVAPASRILGRQSVNLFNFTELVVDGDRGEEAVERP